MGWPIHLAALAAVCLVGARVAVAKDRDAAKERKEFEWNADVEKATHTFIKNLGTVHHRGFSVKLVIRAAESVLEVAEHDDGCRELEKLGVIPKVLDLQRMSEDRVILTTCAGLLLALLRTDNETRAKSCCATATSSLSNTDFSLATFGSSGCLCCSCSAASS